MGSKAWSTVCERRREGLRPNEKRPEPQRPQTAPPPSLPLQTPPHSRRFPPSGRRKLPAALPCPRGAFSGAPAPTSSRVRTWPSPQDSQCAFGQTFWLQPTTLGILASRITSNSSFLHLPPLLSRFPISSSPIGLSSPVDQWKPVLLSDTGSKGMKAGSMVPKGNAGRRLLWSFVSSARPAGSCLSAGRGARGRGALVPGGEKLLPNLENRKGESNYP